MKRSRRLDRVVAAAALTVAYWLIAGFVALALLSGDCFPNGHHNCPTAIDRRHTIVAFTVVAVCLYASGAALFWWKKVRSGLNTGG